MVAAYQLGYRSAGGGPDGSGPSFQDVGYRLTCAKDGRYRLEERPGGPGARRRVVVYDGANTWWYWTGLRSPALPPEMIRLPARYPQPFDDLLRAAAGPAAWERETADASTADGRPARLVRSRATPLTAPSIGTAARQGRPAGRAQPSMDSWAVGDAAELVVDSALDIGVSLRYWLDDQCIRRQSLGNPTAGSVVDESLFDVPVPNDAVVVEARIHPDGRLALKLSPLALLGVGLVLGLSALTRRRPRVARTNADHESLTPEKEWGDHFQHITRFHSEQQASNRDTPRVGAHGDGVERRQT